MSVSASGKRLTFVLRRKFDSSAFVWHRRKGFSALTFFGRDGSYIRWKRAQDGSGRGASAAENRCRHRSPATSRS